MELSIIEKLAINQFLKENWDAFTRLAQAYMEEDEIEKLGDKLSNFH